VPTITVAASGRSLSDLDKLKNYIIEGDMVNGIIFIPKVQLEVENARGHAVISQTVLEGTNLEGTTVGDSTARDGTLKLGLKRGKGGRAPFELNIDLDADLAELPPVLERVVEDEGFLRELALFKDVRGRAHGRLILGDNLKDVKPKVEIKEFNLHCHYERIPYAVEIAGGPFLYENTMVSGESLGGKLGSSTFNNVAALIDWGSESRIEVSSSAALELTLDELHPWLASYGKVKKTLRSIESLKGVIEMSSLHLNGELYHPNDWKLHIQGAVHDLLVRSEDLPGPLSLKEGSFEADQDDLKVSDWQSSLLDASVTVTGKIEGYLDEIHKVDLAFRGAAGSKANQWASDLFHLPSEIKLRSPLSLTKARLEWQKSGRIDFSGDLTVKEGPRVIVDVIKTPSEVSVSNLLIKDDMSDVSLVFDLKNRQFDLSFVGKLSSASVDSLLQTNEFIHGQITGDFRAHILIDQPMESTANGQLQMAGFNYACYGLGSLSIEKAKVEAAGNKLKIESASLDCVGNRFELNGSVEFSEAGFLLDMDLIASGLDWEDLRKFIEYKKEAVVRDRAFWNLPLRGAIRVNAGYFSYASHVWKPLKATISFTPEGEDVHITEAALCGISTPADVKVRSDVLDLGVKPKAVNQDISAAVACLWNKEKEGLIIGSFDLGGEVTVNQDMKAPLTDGLAKSLHGELDFSARNGRIYRWTVLSKIFSLINVTEIYRGKLPDLVNEGFAFDSIKGEGQFSEGKFIVHECIVDGPSMKMVWNGNLNFVDKTMDFTVLVAPLRTVDRIIEYIPFVGYVLGGTLISIPVKVSGDMDDPTVFPLSPSAVGSELLGYMQRVFNLPLKVIQPLMKQGTDHEEK
jgi:hypothetical protein